MSEHNVARNGWRDPAVRELTTLWPHLTVAEIAERLGTSPDSVSRKALRMGLPAKAAAVSHHKIIPNDPIALERRRAGGEPLRAGHPISWGAIAL